MVDDPNIIIAELVDRWCKRKELKALATLLPAWMANNGLTDGWADVRDALKHTYAMESQLPPDERDSLKRAYTAVDHALRNRS